MVGELSIQEIQKYRDGDFTRHFVASNDYVEYFLDKVEVQDGIRWFVHVTVKPDLNTLKAVRKCNRDLIELEEALWNLGIDSLYAVVANEKVYLSFAAMFGFTPIQAVHKEEDMQIKGWVMEKRIG